MRQNDRRRLLKSFTACLLAIAMLLSNVMGAVDVLAQNAVPTPTINPVGANAQEVTGGGLVGSGKRRSLNKDCIIHVIVKDEAGNVKETAQVSIPPKGGSTWKVTLQDKVEAGWTVIAKQEFNGAFSDEATATVKQLLADSHKDKLKMPTGEIWIEEYVANIVNADEKAEALDLLKKANPDIANDIKSIEFKITGATTKTASYVVTYTDDSKTGEIQAPDLTVNQVTETSRGTAIDDITVVDNVIKGKLEGEGSFDGIKVQIILKLSDKNKDTFCNEGGCKIDKNSSDPVDAIVDTTTGEFSYTIPTPDLELNQVVGVSVKEPHKFVSCSTTTVKPAIPEKTEVKDPRKLTDENKTAIDQAIRKANTTKGGVSKLPNGTGSWDGVPAVIRFDDSGNAKIFSGNDVEVTYDSNHNPVPVKNADGSVKLKDGAVPTATIPAEDLVKNIKPEAPAVKLSEDKKNITITPNEKDTDAKTITVSYKDKDGKDQTTTATKADDGTWSISEGKGSADADGVVTLPKDEVKGDTTVTATVTDKGGIADDDKAPLTSEPGTFTVKETIAEKVEALGGLAPVDLKKWVGDKLDWKDGVKAKDSATDKDKIAEYLNGATVTDASEPNARTTEKSGDFAGKVKVRFSDGSEIVVENQMLYVSDLVSPSDKENLPDDALGVEFKLGEGVKVEDKDPNSGVVTKTTEGNKANPVTYKTYKVKPNTDLANYTHPALHKTIFELIDEQADEGYVEPVWKGQDANNANNFVVTAENKVFTATATKTYKVTVVPNGGKGTEIKDTKKTGETYKLPAKDTFTPPNDNQEFSGWKIGEDTNLKQPNETITITGDTVIKAIWKPIEFKATFQTEVGASGTMDPVTVIKGSEYRLPEPKFTPDPGKEFAGWKIGDGTELKQVGEKIDISGNVTLTATWKDKAPAAEEYKVTFDGNGGTGSMEGLTVQKGDKFKLPENKFAPPTGKEFDGWELNGAKHPAGTEVSVSGHMVVKALWKAKGTPDNQDPSQPGKPGGRPLYKGSTLIMPNRASEPVEPAMEIGRHIRYLYGYEDKTVRPEGKITRAEAAALIARLAELDMSDKSKPDFADTPSSWYNSAINIMVKKDLMFGDKNGNFRPNEPITRGEFARALLYIDKKNDKVAPFADVKGHEFEEAINQAFGNGRINGYPDGTFRPDAYIQRAEAARILNQYANRGTTLEGMAPVAKDLARFTDIDESHWAYCEVMEAANSHEYQRAKGTQAETWLKILYDEMKK